MPTNTTPLFFCSSLMGVTPDGPNVVLSFGAPVPSQDHRSVTYEPNVRIVMSSGAVDHLVNELTRMREQGAQLIAKTQAMPETPQ